MIHNVVYYCNSPQTQWAKSSNKYEICGSGKVSENMTKISVILYPIFNNKNFIHILEISIKISISDNFSI